MDSPDYQEVRILADRPSLVGSDGRFTSRLVSRIGRIHPICERPSHDTNSVMEVADKNGPRARTATVSAEVSDRFGPRRAFSAVRSQVGPCDERQQSTCDPQRDSNEPLPVASLRSLGRSKARPQKDGDEGNGNEKEPNGKIVVSG